MDARWQNITDPVFHYARERPDAPAFRQGPETLTYGELALLVGKAAVHLDGIDIRSGDRVAINLTNSIDHFILTLALLRLGATTMEIPYNVQQPPSTDLLAQFAMHTVFIEPMAAPVAGCTSIKIDAGWRGLLAGAHGDRRSDDDGNGIFTISLTSGTTGRPKGNLTTLRSVMPVRLPPGRFRLAAFRLQQPFATDGMGCKGQFAQQQFPQLFCIILTASLVKGKPSPVTPPAQGYNPQIYTMNIKELDLNLLVTVRALLLERNVTRAADRLKCLQDGPKRASIFSYLDYWGTPPTCRTQHRKPKKGCCWSVNRWIYTARYPTIQSYKGIAPYTFVEIS